MPLASVVFLKSQSITIHSCLSVYFCSSLLMNGVTLKNLEPRQNYSQHQKRALAKFCKLHLLGQISSWYCREPRISAIVTHCTGHGHTTVSMPHETPPVTTLWKTSFSCLQSWHWSLIWVNTTVPIQAPYFVWVKRVKKMTTKIWQMGKTVVRRHSELDSNCSFKRC